MLDNLTQKKSVLGERAVDAVRQHAHIDTNRTYNMTTRPVTCGVCAAGTVAATRAPSGVVNAAGKVVCDRARSGVVHTGGMRAHTIE